MERNCPTCENTALKATFRQKVEIDYCPKCNGIWLDNGELNKIIEHHYAREEKPISSFSQASTSSYQTPSDSYYRKDKRYKKTKKASSFLDDVFDIFDLGGE